MKKQYIYIIVVLAAALMAGCSKDAQQTQLPTEPEPTPGDNTQLTIRAGVRPATPYGGDPTTRVSYDSADQYVKWEQGDTFGLFVFDADENNNLNQSCENAMFTIDDTSLSGDGRAADFTGTIGFTPEQKNVQYWGYYPFHENGTSDYHAGTIKFQVPSIQNYVPGGFTGLPMATKFSGAPTDNVSLEFVNLFSIFRIPVKASTDGVKLKSIVFTCNDGSNLAGDIYFNISTSVYEITSIYGLSSITLDCGSQGVALSTVDAVDFHIGVPVLEYANGFSFTFTTTDGTITKMQAGFAGTGKTQELNTVYTVPAVTLTPSPHPIPDPGFRAWLLANDYIDQQGVRTAAADGVTELNLSGNKSIFSLEGISTIFPGLKTLWCYDTNITGELDLSGLHSLVELRCGDNSTTSIKLPSDDPLIEILACENTAISELNISHLTKLTRLYCSNNNISELNLPDSPLESLQIENTNISSLTLPLRAVLKELSCGFTNITALPWDRLSTLINLDAGYTNIEGGLQLQYCPQLEYLYAYGVSGDIDLSGCPHIRDAYIGNEGTGIGKLDITGCNQVYIGYMGNRLAQTSPRNLTIPSYIPIKELIADGTTWNIISITNNPTLERVSLQNCTINKLTVTGNANLMTFDRAGTTVTTESISGNGFNN